MVVPRAGVAGWEIAAGISHRADVGAVGEEFGLRIWGTGFGEKHGIGPYQGVLGIGWSLWTRNRGLSMGRTIRC